MIFAPFTLSREIRTVFDKNEYEAAWNIKTNDIFQLDMIKILDKLRIRIFLDYWEILWEKTQKHGHPGVLVRLKNGRLPMNAFRWLAVVRGDWTLKEREKKWRA